MKQKQFPMTQMIENSWLFIKEQLNLIDTWFFITLMSNLAFLGILITFLGIIALMLSYIVFNAPVVLDFSQTPYVFIMYGLVCLVMLYICRMLLKKMVGFMNVVPLNSLDQVLNRPMRRFEKKDERLSFLALYFFVFFITFIGLLFLIIPGIFFLLRASMSYCIMLEEKCSPFQAISKSIEMTRGNFWQLLIGLLLVHIVTVIPLLNIINLFIPFTTWNSASLYAQLKRNNID